MNGYMDHMVGWYGFPFYGFGMMFWWVIFLVIGFIVYQDANKRGLNGLLWFILVILPVIGVVFLLLYVVLRESQSPVQVETTESHDTALKLLKERYAKGEITREEYLKTREDLEK